MRASLPMYDIPALKSAHKSYWSHIRAALQEMGMDAPPSLSGGMDIWTAQDLLLSQTCGMPYRTKLAQSVDLVGTPDYALPDCPPGYYYSVLIKRPGDGRSTLGDFDGARVAINEYGSQSGFAALAGAAQDAAISFAEVQVTGAHAASIKAVATGAADVAAIDAVTWALLCTHEGANSQAEAFARTEPTPGLPYICAPGVDGDRVAAGVRKAMETMPPADRDALMLKGLVDIPPQTYTTVPTPDPEVLTAKPAVTTGARQRP